MTIYADNAATTKMSLVSRNAMLDAMDKGDLFKTVILDGALPRKTFSMGDACDKRFYTEARIIQK